MSYDTHNRLIERGYTQKGFGTCSSCGVPVTWYQTPAKRWIPYDKAKTADPLQRIVSHFATCVNSKAHKAAADKKRLEATRATETQPQPSLFGSEAING